MSQGFDVGPADRGPEDVFLPRRTLATRPADEQVADVPSILIFGHDPTLLGTRGLILSRHGLATRVAAQLSEAERSLVRDPIRVLILCYTLDELECARALALARARPDIRSLLMMYGHSGCGDAHPDEVLDVLDGPEKLLFAVDKLLDCSPRSNSHDS